jgi:histidine triad (HIT) family protein
MENNDCIFCAIVEGKVPTEKVGENEGAIAFYDQNPSAERHILIIPRLHIPTFLDLTEHEPLNSMKSLTQELIKKLEVDEAYKLVFNGGSYQHVPHVHWHLLGGSLTRRP